MTVPNSQQLAQAHATGRLPIAGAHTVGAPDGGRGLPVTGWSADHGDLRIAHFLGMHGLQVLPLFAWWIARRPARPDQRTQRNLIFAAAASYLALFGLVLWQAFRGQSIAQPDGLSLASFAVWLVVTVVTVIAIRGRRVTNNFGLRKAFHDGGWAFSTLQQRGAGRVAAAIGHPVVGSCFTYDFFTDHRSAGAGAVECLYLVLIITHWGGHRGGFSSLSGVMLLFTDRWLVLAGSVHYLAFDLFIGSWPVRDARRNRVPFVLVVPCLVLTFLFGPIGLLLYLFLAGVASRRESLARPPGSCDLASSLSLPTVIGCPISRSFFARCGTPLR